MAAVRGGPNGSVIRNVRRAPSVKPGRCPATVGFQRMWQAHPPHSQPRNRYQPIYMGRCALAEDYVTKKVTKDPRGTGCEAQHPASNTVIPLCIYIYRERESDRNLFREKNARERERENKFVHDLFLPSWLKVVT
jgi:hypothetical protein